MKAPVESQALETRSCLEVKAGHDGKLLHGQLLGRLLVTMAAAAFDFSAAAEMLRSGEPGGRRGERLGPRFKRLQRERRLFSRNHEDVCAVMLGSLLEPRGKGCVAVMLFTCADSR